MWATPSSYGNLLKIVFDKWDSRSSNKYVLFLGNCVQVSILGHHKKSAAY